MGNFFDIFITLLYFTYDIVCLRKLLLEIQTRKLIYNRTRNISKKNKLIYKLGDKIIKQNFGVENVTISRVSIPRTQSMRCDTISVIRYYMYIPQVI